MAIPSMSSFGRAAGLAARVRRRKAGTPWRAFFYGLLLRRRMTSGSGILAVMPGLPRPQVINRGGEIHVEACSLFSGVRLAILRGGRIFIGKGTYLNRNTEVIAQQEVRIGRMCSIAWDVVIMDTDQHAIGGGPPVAKPVLIGDGVWISCRAIVLKGVRIGGGAVVGAGAIVTHDVPAGAVFTGPAATQRSAPRQA